LLCMAFLVRRGRRAEVVVGGPAEELTMRPTWLIEAGVYGAEADPLLAEIRRQGMAAEVVSHRTLLKEKDIIVGDRTLADGDCVVAYGTYPVPGATRPASTPPATSATSASTC
jgi:hypothetical protein